MDIQDTLKQTIAEFFQIEPDQVTGDLDFHQRMSGSIARARLDAAIQRRLKIKCPQVHTANSYAELESAILGKPLDAPAPQRLSAPTPADSAIHAPPSVAVATGSFSGNIACGIDIESPESLPAVADYWESDFYRLNFSPTEIAYCVAQDEPRQHFAARWCAKESLKKCDAKYLSVEMNRIEVAIDDAGKPSLYLRLGDTSTKLPIIVSLTHIGTLAAAIVIAVERTSTAAAESNHAEKSTASTTAFARSVSKPQPKKGLLSRLFGF
jgi:holo-[acyl-carrier protein] synthase